MTVVLITLTFCSLLFVSGLFEGIFDGINNQIRNTRSSDLIIEPSDKDQYIKNATALMNVISHLPGVTFVHSRYSTGAIFSFDKDKNGQNIISKSFSVYGVDPEKERQISKVATSLVEGAYLTKDDRDKILVGVNISGTHGSTLYDSSLKGVKVGDDVTVRYPNGVSKKYTIKGVYRTFFSLSDAGSYVTKDEVESVLGQYNTASEVIVRLRDDLQPDIYAAKLRDLGYSGIKITTLHQYTRRVISDLQDALFFIQTIINMINVIVAGITIFIIIFINVSNKKRQIGILKAIGIPESVIILSYVFQALFYVVVGITLGTILLYTVIQPYVLAHPLSFPFGPVVLFITAAVYLQSIGLLFAIGLIGSFVPSRQVTSISILDAIWGT